MNQSREVLENLTEIQIAGQLVKLINVYKSVPISFDARIKSISFDAVLLKVHKYQAFCMQQSKYTYIDSNMLPKVVKGYVVNLDVDKNLAVLTDLSYIEGRIGDRELIRVEPKGSVNVLLINGIKSNGDLVNISLRGIGIFLDQGSFTPKAFGEEQRILLNFQMPNSDQKINIIGVVKNVSLDKAMKRYRIGIQIYPDQNTELEISRYVAHRQAEILREIKMLLGIG
ncbi:MAG: PilZ domain-containing protein [Chloroflexota bacterium]